MTKAPPEKHITRADLAHSYAACYRLEAAVIARLRMTGMDERTTAIRVVPVLLDMATQASYCPTWCEFDAWVAIVQMVARWATTYGNLQRFQELRRTKEKAVPTVALDESD